MCVSAGAAGVTAPRRATRADPGRVSQRPVATVLSLERPTADVLDAFLQRRSTAAYNHPFVGCTSLVNDIVSIHGPCVPRARARAKRVHVHVIFGTSVHGHACKLTSVCETGGTGRLDCVGVQGGCWTWKEVLRASV
jgi:hypothetical protein